MGVFCDRLKLGCTAVLDCRTGQNKSRYRKKKALIPTRLIDVNVAAMPLLLLHCDYTNKVNEEWEHFQIAG